MVRLLPLLLLVAIVVACGGDDDDDDASSESQPDTTSDAATATATTASTSAADDESSGAERVVVTIGTETFEFDVIRQPGCVLIGGQVSGSAEMTGGAVTFGFTIPPEDWETNERFRNPPDISLVDESSDPAVLWRAGGPGGNVDSYAIDGGRASGSATFVSEAYRGDPDFVSETASGTFDIDCGR